MKQIFWIIGAAVFSFGCNKEDVADSVPPPNTWKVGYNSYASVLTAGLSSGSMYTLTASTGNGASVNGIIFYFNGGSVPGAGNYKIAGTNHPAAGEVYFVATEGNSSFAASGFGSAEATVTTANKKISISMPAVWAKSSVRGDSVRVSANLTQTQ
jgi:hypothetical protein